MLADSTITSKPAIDLQETETDLILKAEVPGVRTRELSVRIESETILITGEHREQSWDPKSLVCQELHPGRFLRVVPLPKPVRSERAIAELIDGVLTVIMPKSEEN
ncbi:Hsp20/alpha crystallin family protein [Pleurocapsales cyanobacterium LEGE 06147]|nr:Hsp20/alpha crystallin family protein [Pleurocapsales cyanobacterium LEGE 06147]